MCADFFLHGVVFCFNCIQQHAAQSVHLVDLFRCHPCHDAAKVGVQCRLALQARLKRPAIGTVVPCKDGCFMMLDSGANHDCRPEMLRQFGLMGSVYMKRILGVPNPRVGLVNIGVEETKGTELQVEAYGLMKEAGYNFIGNVEAREVPLGGCDVAVCDGFTGNVILKLTEGVAKMLLGMLKEMFLANLGGKIAYLLLKSGVGSLKHQMDSEEYGGAPFLGAKQPVIKAHGSSKAKGIKNAIRQAKICVENDLCGTMQSALDELTTSQAD